MQSAAYFLRYRMRLVGRKYGRDSRTAVAFCGCFVEDGIELAAVVSEVVDEFGKSSIHFDTQELLEDALSYGEAGGS